MQRSKKLIGCTAIAAAIAANVVSSAQAAKTSVDTNRDGRTSVTAPGTRVTVVPKRTKVQVAAPYTNVKVDTAAGHVRIRVPYFSGDIFW